jgi:hypothetical protein
MKRLQNLVSAIAVLLACGSHAAIGAQADAWKAEWGKTVEEAKKEGQLVIYGSPEFETLYAEFHKKYPEIRITGVFNRGADVAKRLMAERRAEKYLGDLYLDGMTTGYLQSESARSNPASVNSSRSHRYVKMVAAQAPLRRSRK